MKFNSRSSYIKPKNLRFYLSFTCLIMIKDCTQISNGSVLDPLRIQDSRRQGIKHTAAYINSPVSRQSL